MISDVCLDLLIKRLIVNERNEIPIPKCATFEAMIDAELNEMIEFLDGRRAELSPDLAAKKWSEPSPNCQICSRQET
jgi:hypothetical protein